MRITVRQRVQWGETDAAGIVFYPNYFRWFDAAAHELFRSLRYPVERMMSAGFAVPIVEARGRFLSPLRYNDELEISAHIAEIRTRALRLEYSVARAGEQVGTGHEVRMWVRLGASSLEALPIPDDVRRSLVAD